MPKHTHKQLICKDKNGLQSRLRRFDSDPSLQNPVLRRPNKVNDVANTWARGRSKASGYPAGGAVNPLSVKPGLTAIRQRLGEPGTPGRRS